MLNEQIEKETQEEKYKELSHTFEDIWEEKEVTVKARFKKPSPIIIKRMQSMAAKDTARASTTLLIDCCHKDDLDSLKANLEKYPATATTLSSVILKACGVSTELGN